MTIESHDLIDVVDVLVSSKIDVSLDGGWGVDAS
jgi:hypothetical protein